MWSDGQVTFFDAAGRARSSRALAMPQVRALSFDGAEGVVGSVDGRVALVREGELEFLPGTPQSAIERVELLEHVVIATYNDGWVGAWDRAQHALIATARLHGPARFIAGRDEVTVASTLSSTATLDLRPLRATREELLDSVQREAVTWREGRVVAAPVGAQP